MYSSSSIKDEYGCELSVVIPLHNEEECVEILFERTHRSLETLGKSYEILMIDDGSTDHTFEILSKLADKWKGVLRVVKLRQNYGQTTGMMAGFDLSKGRCIATMDGDLQNDPEDIPMLLKRLDEGFDVASGWRIKRQDASITRKFPSKVANWIISRLTGVRLHDYGCSLKVYRARCIKGLKFYSDMHRFFPALAANLTGARVVEVPVRHYPRSTGVSKYGLSRIYKVLADVISLQLVTRFIHRPIYWFGFCAAPFFLLGGLLMYACGFLPVGEYMAPTTVILGTALLLLSAGFYSITHGMLCEYVVRAGEIPGEEGLLVQSESVGGMAHV
jgi:glycosyltransferase involved in cell wall biosynthesis